MIDQNYSESEITVDLVSQVRILFSYIIPASNVSFFNRVTDLQVLNDLVQGLVGYDVGLFLILLGVDKQSPTSHCIHILVLGAHIDINSLVVKQISIALDVELIDVEYFPTLDQHWKSEFQEGG